MLKLLNRLSRIYVLYWGNENTHIRRRSTRNPQSSGKLPKAGFLTALRELEPKVQALHQVPWYDCIENPHRSNPIPPKNYQYFTRSSRHLSKYPGVTSTSCYGMTAGACPRRRPVPNCLYSSASLAALGISTDTSQDIGDSADRPQVSTT